MAISYQHNGVWYLNPNYITNKRQTATPPNRSRTGYGSKVATSWMIQVKDPSALRPKQTWHRVYVVQWSNAGSAYIIYNKKKLFLGAYDPNY